jgi:ParB-like chromosome segregation protein Spo0J
MTSKKEQIHRITVRPNGDGVELVAGESRLLAAESLGWRKIIARVGNFDDEQCGRSKPRRMPSGST